MGGVPHPDMDETHSDPETPKTRTTLDELDKLIDSESPEMGPSLLDFNEELVEPRSPETRSSLGDSLPNYHVSMLRSSDRRYVATLAPAAKNDLLAMPFGDTKKAFQQLFSEGNPQNFAEDVDFEDRPDWRGGWSSLRLGGYVALYRPLTSAERHGAGGADIVVSRVVRILDYQPQVWLY
jgi:hypothetical protein